MSNTVDASLIILTHKRKLLLVLRDNKPTITSPNCWSFIGGTKDAGESFEDATKRETAEEIGIILRNIVYLKTLLYEDRRKYIYHAELTDEQVKTINLTEGQRYNFFTSEDTKKVDLAYSTSMFLSEYGDLIKAFVD